MINYRIKKTIMSGARFTVQCLEDTFQNLSTLTIIYDLSF